MLNEARKIALDHADSGLFFLAKAMNAYGDKNIYYRYGDAEQERFKEIFQELMSIVENGKIILAANARARCDKDFQSFMKKIKVAS